MDADTTTEATAILKLLEHYCAGSESEILACVDRWLRAGVTANELRRVCAWIDSQPGSGRPPFALKRIRAALRAFRANARGSDRLPKGWYLP